MLKQVLPDAVEAGGICEIRELDLTSHLRRGLPGLCVSDGAVRGNGDRLRLRGDRNGRLDGVSAGGDDVAVHIELEAAVPRVTQLAVWELDLKKALALNAQVERIVGFLEISLRKNDFVGRRTSTQANLKSAGDDSLRASRRPRLDETLIQKILKLRGSHLKAVGVGVGQVVGDVVHVHLLRRHSTGRAIKCSDHLSPSPEIIVPDGARAFIPACLR